MKYIYFLLILITFSSFQGIEKTEIDANQIDLVFVQKTKEDTPIRLSERKVKRLIKHWHKSKEVVTTEEFEAKRYYTIIFKNGSLLKLESKKKHIKGQDKVYKIPFVVRLF